MLRTILGSMPAEDLVATRSDTKPVIAGGYSKGAGSKVDGSCKGIVVGEGWFRYAQAMTRTG